MLMTVNLKRSCGSSGCCYRCRGRRAFFPSGTSLDLQRRVTVLEVLVAGFNVRVFEIVHLKLRVLLAFLKREDRVLFLAEGQQEARGRQGDGQKEAHEDDDGDEGVLRVQLVAEAAVIRTRKAFSLRQKHGGIDTSVCTGLGQCCCWCNSSRGDSWVYSCTYHVSGMLLLIWWLQFLRAATY